MKESVANPASLICMTEGRVCWTCKHGPYPGDCTKRCNITGPHEKWEPKEESNGSAVSASVSV